MFLLVLMHMNGKRISKSTLPVTFYKAFQRSRFWGAGGRPPYGKCDTMCFRKRGGRCATFLFAKKNETVVEWLALPRHSEKVVGLISGPGSFLCGVCVFSPGSPASKNMRLRRTGNDLSRVSPCPRPVTAELGSSRPHVTPSSGRSRN